MSYQIKERVDEEEKTPTMSEMLIRSHQGKDQLSIATFVGEVSIPSIPKPITMDQEYQIGITLEDFVANGGKDQKDSDEERVDDFDLPRRDEEGQGVRRTTMTNIHRGSLSQIANEAAPR